MIAFPDTTTPEELADKLGWSARRVRETARRLAACRIMGNRMVLFQEDVDAILEASRPCRLNPINETDGGGSKENATAYRAANTTDKALEYLARLRNRKPQKPSRSSRPDR